MRFLGFFAPFLKRPVFVAKKHYFSALTLKKAPETGDFQHILSRGEGSSLKSVS
jgi:hypothetical protein